MISEHEFANRYASVWHDLTPRSDGYWKIENLLVTREYTPIFSRTTKDVRGVINDASFRVFCVLCAFKEKIDRTRILSEVDTVKLETIEYIRRFAPNSTINESLFDDDCREEVADLAKRMLDHFTGHQLIVPRPLFRGCGMISACEGDVLSGDCLYEIKAGDRAFRIADLRQLLVYSALAYSAGSLSFSKIGLFNPRTGSEWIRTLEHVCLSISGVRAVDTLSALANHFSSMTESI
jgi:hypothetical protein